MHYFLGLYYVDLGWHYRGIGMATEVTPEGWRRVAENLPLGTLHLRYAWALDPKLPVAPRKMIFVSGAGFDDDTSPYQWFLRATAAQFDDWSHLAAGNAQPSLGGVSSALAFGEQCLGRPIRRRCRTSPYSRSRRCGRKARTRTLTKAQASIAMPEQRQASGRPS
jgi:hypothetical protein